MERIHKEAHKDEEAKISKGISGVRGKTPLSTAASDPDFFYPSKIKAAKSWRATQGK